MCLEQTLAMCLEQTFWYKPFYKINDINPVSMHHLPEKSLLANLEVMCLIRYVQSAIEHSKPRYEI
jgi:hypothetical protein